MKLMGLVLMTALMLPWVRDNRPCPQCDCGLGNWRDCSVFCYTRNKGGESSEQRPLTKAERKQCTSMCPTMCERPKK